MTMTKQQMPSLTKLIMTKITPTAGVHQKLGQSVSMQGQTWLLMISRAVQMWMRQQQLITDAGRPVQSPVTMQKQMRQCQLPT